MSRQLKATAGKEIDGEIFQSGLPNAIDLHRKKGGPDGLPNQVEKLCLPMKTQRFPDIASGGIPTADLASQAAPDRYLAR